MTQQTLPPWCTRKIRFATHGDAMRARSKAIRTMRDRPIPHRAYHCPDCHGWHLTKKPLRRP